MITRHVSPFKLSLALAGLLSLAAAGFLLPTRDAAPRPAAEQAAAKADYGRLPLYFVANEGQTDPRVAYYLQGRDKSVAFTDEGLTFVLSGREAASPRPEPASLGTELSARPRHVLRLDFVGARRVRPEGEGKTEAVFSYFKGEKDDWRAGVASYARLVYRDLWPGIDLEYAGTVDRMKYTFRVKPGADPSVIKMAYRGADGVRVNEVGELEVSTPIETFHDERPVSFQEVGGKQVEVATSFSLGSDGGEEGYGFALGDYDRSRELVIDPAVLVYAGFVGGDGSDVGLAIAVDSAGNAYVTGYTQSTDASFPVAVGPDLTYNGDFDAFVAKVRADGTGLAYCGYLGGGSVDAGYGVAVDVGGSAYLTGYTFSSEASFPVTIGPDLTYNGFQEAFVAKINATGAGLLYCGYLGGVGSEAGFGIAVDAAGNAYVTGTTLSTEASFPVTIGPDLTYNGGDWDAFVAKVSLTGAGLLYCGYLGGTGRDDGSGIAVDAAGNAYLTGRTTSTETTFPEAVGPDLTHNGGTDAFVAKVSATGAGLLYCGYLGGVDFDDGDEVAVDAAGNAYVTSSTRSTEASFPVAVGPDLSYNGGPWDAYVAKVRADGTGLLYCGYLGGEGEDYGLGIAVDSAGSAYVAGQTSSTEASFPATIGPDLTYNGGLYDAFVAKVTADGSGLAYRGYIGGGGDDFGYGIAVDATGQAYVAGWTNSSEATFPDGDGFGALPGPDQNKLLGEDAFVVKVAVCDFVIAPTSANFPPAGGAGSIDFLAGEDCPWDAVSNDSWITVTGAASGSGYGTVDYSVAPNAGAAVRVGTITIAGQTFTVRQGLDYPDVDQDDPFAPFIGRIWAAGITIGCGYDAQGRVLFCPDQPVTRDQMAAFISRALGVFNPMPPAVQAFADVPPSSPFYAFVEEVRLRGITSGCGPGLYCPAQPVTREQMAAFLIRALGEFAPPVRPRSASSTCHLRISSTRSSTGWPSAGSRSGARSRRRSTAPGRQ